MAIHHFFIFLDQAGHLLVRLSNEIHPHIMSTRMKTMSSFWTLRVGTRVRSIFFVRKRTLSCEMNEKYKCSVSKTVRCRYAKGRAAPPRLSDVWGCSPVGGVPGRVPPLPGARHHQQARAGEPPLECGPRGKKRYSRDTQHTPPLARKLCFWRESRFLLEIGRIESLAQEILTLLGILGSWRDSRLL